MGNYLNGLGKEVCNHCNLKRTPEGHDGCIGILKGVRNACCGHGEVKMAYIQFDHKDYDENPNKVWLGGKTALEYIKKNS